MLQEDIETALPVFRAEIDFEMLDWLSLEDFGGNKYLYGIPFRRGTCIKLENDDEYHVKKDTWAIHFPNMLANSSERLLEAGEIDLRIFASLREDGKGGDMSIYSRGNYHNVSYVCKMISNIPYFVCDDGKISGATTKETCLMFTITGIQE